MKTLTLSVPDDRCTDKWWSSIPPDRLASILEATGSFLSAFSELDTVRQMQELQCRLDGATNMAETMAAESSKHVETVFSTRIKDKDDMILVLQEQCASMRAMLDQARATMDAQQKIEVSRSVTSAQQMGTVAEDELEKVISDTIACDVVDTSHETGKGDRFITTPDGLRMMLEVKYAQRLHSKHDIEKFHNDVYASVQSGRINAAFFVSLRTNSLPNSGPGSCTIHFETGPTGRVPVVMLASAARTTIQLAVHAIAQLQSIADKENTARGGPVQIEALEKERATLQKTLPAIVKHMFEMDTAIESRLELLQRLVDEANQERNKQRDVVFQLSRLQQSVQWLNISQESDNDQAINLVLRWFERKGEYPKTSEMTVAQRSAIKTAGGLKNVIDQAKKRVRTDDTIATT